MSAKRCEAVIPAGWMMFSDWCRNNTLVYYPIYNRLMNQRIGRYKRIGIGMNGYIIVPTDMDAKLFARKSRLGIRTNVPKPLAVE